MNNQLRPIGGSAAQQHGDNESLIQMTAGIPNLPFAASINEAGHIYQFAAQYPDGYHQHDPGFDLGCHEAFGLESGDYRLNIDATWNSFVQQQGSNFMPPWSQFSGTEYLNNLDVNSTSHNYPLSDSSFNVTTSNEQAALASWKEASPAADSVGGSMSCEIQSCSVTCNTRREMTRHMTTIHGDKEYTCKCGYYTGRKDNYVRHLRESCKKKHSPGRGFTCICGEQFSEYDTHLDHVKMCGIRRAGRPSKSSRHT